MKKSNQRRKNRTRTDERTVTVTHLSEVVDRLRDKIDYQSVALASRLDEITRRIGLVDLTQSEINRLLRKTTSDDEKKPAPQEQRLASEPEDSDVIGA